MKTPRAALAFAASFFARSEAFAQETTALVSVDSSGGQGNGHSGLNDAGHDAQIGISIAADGSAVAFASEASNLVAGDTNGKRDVFLHERTTGATERISVDSSGAEGDGHSIEPSASADGLVVAFESVAKNLVAGDTNGVSDLFVRDRLTGTTERISVNVSGTQGNGPSYLASLSADGTIVAFVSGASNLVAGDTNGRFDVFVHDRSTGTTKRVSVDSSGSQANDDSWSPSISADGQVVVFQSNSSNLVAGDTNGKSDVFVHDRSTGATERVSVASSGAQANDDSYAGIGPSTSSDGRIVAFASWASNLVAGDSNGESDVFVHDRSTGATELVSVSTKGVQGNWPSYVPSLSADGQVVAFFSYASNLLEERTSGLPNVFVHDRSNGVTELASVDSSGIEGDSGSEYASLSADGQVVAFESIAGNLVPDDDNGFADVFVHERCVVAASWSNYGEGFAGTLGIPSLTARANPVRGTTLVLDVGNSSGGFAFGLLVLGFERANLHSSWGGDLLVDPLFNLAIGLAPAGTSVIGDLLDDDRLCGFVIDVQVIESDPGAPRGASFTPGLELVLGR
jgi:Tol biopolymer transport system component